MEAAVQVSPKEHAVEEAFVAALGHAPPFSSDELAGISRPLVVRSARSLADLVHCSRLQSLQLIGGDIADLTPIQSLSQLAVLRILGARLGPLAPLAACRSISTFDLDFTTATDLAPVLQMNIERGRLLGNPWD